MASFATLITEVRGCSLCRAHLPHGVRPVLQIDPRARVLIAAQAPGRKVHASGVPFDDLSGERPREWMGVTSAVFHDARQIAILPMGFCYPGAGKTGDLPPRPECTPAWRAPLLAHLRQVAVTLVVGQYAQAYHLDRHGSTLTATVQDWKSAWPSVVPLPHPSPRNNIWLARNPRFERELLPQLRRRIARALAR